MRNLLFVFCCVLFSSNGILGQFVEKQVIAPLGNIDSPYGFSLADMDKDGDLDVVTFENFNKISWIENKGTGRFDGSYYPIENQSLSSKLLDIHASDLNGDGNVDILACFEKTQTLTWYVGSSSGVFGKKQPLCTDCENLKNVHAADIDGDGDMDVISSQDSFEGKLSWYKNDGKGNFGEALLIADGAFNNIKTADLDGDGDEDILCDYESFNTTRIFINLGGGEFESLQTVPGRLSKSDNSLLLTDMNHDGSPDIVVFYDDDIVWIGNDGNGYFDTENDQHLMNTPNNSYNIRDITLIDVDSDGELDIAWTNNIQTNFTEFRLFWNKNLGNGVFETNGTKWLRLSAPLLIGDMNPVDFNEDNHQDIMIGSRWYAGDGLGNFNTEEINLIYNSVKGVQKIQMTDMDSDGDLDLVSISSRNLSWFEQKSDHSFKDIHILHTMQNTDGNIDFEIADLNNDGRSDIAFISEEESYVGWCTQLENGNFQCDALSNTPFAPSNILVKDIDSDGDIDILVVNRKDLLKYENLGNNQFSENYQIIHSTISDYPPIIITDFNNDGSDDLILHFTYAFAWYEQDNEENFSIQHFIGVDHSSNYRCFQIADLDQDGRKDIIYEDFSSLGWVRNIADDSYEDKHIENTSIYGVININVEDLDKDGDMDIQFVNDKKVENFLNNGTQSFFKRENFFSTSLEYGTSLQMIDLNQDGDKEILQAYSAHFLHGKIILYNNLHSNAQIHSTTFFDENENGIWEEQEPPLNNQTILLNPDALAATSNKLGTSNFYVKPGNYQLTYQEQTLWELSTPDEVYDITINENYEETTYLFGFKPARTLHRVYPNLTSTSTRCNEEIPFWLNYLNTGTTVAEGTISLQADGLADFISADPEPNYEEDGKLFWEISDLYPTQEQKIKLFYRMPNADAIGQDITMKAHVHLVNPNNETVYNKEVEYTSELRCSYDPNDKLAQTEQYGNQELVWQEDSLYYTIRFQNTGNDFARDVRITDFLDKKLDWTTFHPLTSSHDMETSLNRNTGEITFLFEDIMLPDSTTNEPESHGFVTYSIAPISNIEDKTEINNTAFIYFDFNTPIITNTTSHITTANPATSIATHQPQLYLNVYPNPSKDHWHIHLQYPTTQNYQLKLLDVTGKLLQSYTKLQNGTNLIERKGLQSGVYFLQLEGEAGKVLGMGKLLVE